MKNLIYIGVVLAVVIAGFAVFNSKRVKDVPDVTAVVTDTAGGVEVASQEAGVLAGVALPDFAGNTHNIVSDKQITVINSWATWCLFCTRELPDFVILQKEFTDKVAVVIVNRSESKSKARTKLDEIGIKDSDVLSLLDDKNTFFTTIGGFTSPETVFTDSLGNILFHKRGPMTLEEMRDIINGLLKN